MDRTSLAVWQVWQVFNAVFILWHWRQQQTGSGCLAAIPTQHSRIPIGTIFGRHDDIVARTAMMYAISTHHNQADTPPITFEYQSETIDTDSPFQVTSTICSMMATGVFSLFGSTSQHSHSTCQAYSNKFHMPFITNRLTGPVSRDPPSPYMLFAKPVYADALVDLIKYYGWKRIDYVYDSDEGLMRVQYVYDRLKKEKYIVEMGFRQVSNTDSAHEELRRLDYGGMEEMRNIVIDVSSPRAYAQLLRQIPEVGMNRHGYNYILGSMDMESLDISRFQHGGANLTGFQMVQHHSGTVADFMKGWGPLESLNWPGAGGPVLKLDAALSVDGLRIILESLTQMIREDSTVFQHTFRRKKLYNQNKTEGIPCNAKPPLAWMHGERIYKAMKQVRFQGLSGWLQFDDHGYRTNYSMDILSVGYDSSLYRVAKWHSDLGIMAEDYEPTFVDLLPDFLPELLSPVLNVGRSSWELSITTILEPPFLMLREDTSEDGVPLLGNNKFKGYVKDLADELKKRLSFHYVLNPVTDGEYGRELANGTWTGMVGKLMSGEADMAIAPLTIIAARERVVDFSKPFMTIGISMMSKRPEIQKPGLFSFLEPFSFMLWASIVFAYFTVSFIIFAVSRISPYEPHNRQFWDGRVRPNFSLCNSFWFVMGALMMQGSDLCPRSTAGRIIGGAWWFFVLIIISSYTANLAAFLTIERMVQPVGNVDDLAKQTEIAYGMLESGATRQFFEHSNVSIYRKMWTYMSTANPPTMVKSVQEGVHRVQNSGGKYVFLLESSTNDYFNNRKPCSTVRVGSNLNLEGFGIATPQGSSLKNDINYVTLQLKEKGVLHRLQQKWWQEEGECGASTANKESNKRSLSLSNVAGAFLILIAGLVLAIGTGLIEARYLESQNSSSSGSNGGSVGSGSCGHNRAKFEGNEMSAVHSSNRGGYTNGHVLRCRTS